MRHVQNRRPLPLEGAEHIEQMIGLRIRQRGRRLVEHENLAFECEGARHLQQLAMRRRQGLGGRIRIDTQGQPIENRARALAHLRVTQPAARMQFAAGEDIGADAQVGEREHLLIDHADAAIDRVARARHFERLVAPADVAALGPNDARENLQQRRFAGAVLTDNRVRLALGDVKADAGQSPDGTERLADVAKFETCHARSGSF